MVAAGSMSLIFLKKKSAAAMEGGCSVPIVQEVRHILTVKCTAGIY